MPAGPHLNPGLAFWRTLKKVEKAKVNNRWMAFRNAFAVAVPLAVGISMGNAAGAAAVTTGALNVSFSDGRDPYYRRARRMLTWSLLGSLAVFIGSVTGNHNLAAILIAAAWAFAAGMLMAVSTKAGDLGLNTLVALIVFAGRAATSPRGALNTALLVLAGGLLQSAFCLAFWPVRRYAPERRAIANVFLDLAALLNPDSDPRPAAFAEHTQDEQDTLAALGNDHSIEGERFRLLFDQADRLRLSTYLLSRLRDQLGEGDNQASEAEGDAAETLDALLRVAVKTLKAVAQELKGEFPSRAPAALLCKEELEQITEAAHQLKNNPSLPLAANIGAAADVMAGQLRSVIRLAESSTFADNAQRIAPPGEPGLSERFSNWFEAIGANLDVRSAICRHAIRLSLCIAAGDWIERSLGWQRAYWLPMTVAVILKPDFTSTFSRGVLRLLGTFAGLFISTLLFHILPASSLTQLAVVGAFTFLLRYLGPANYGVFSFAVSGLVVFLIAVTGVAPGEVIAARALNTLVGGLLALLAYAIWPTWERARVPDAFADMFDASRLYLQRIFGNLAGAGGGLSDERLAWLRARSNVEVSVDRVISEPGTSSGERDTLLSMLASSHALLHAMMGLEAGASHATTQATPAELRTFAHDVDFTLYYLASALRGSLPATQLLPELRADYRRLLDAQPKPTPENGFILLETDRLTVSLNTLREQVMRYVSVGTAA